MKYKQIKWLKAADQFRGEIFYGDVTFGTYKIMLNQMTGRQRVWRIFPSHPQKNLGEFETIEQAKIQCQKDWEQLLNDWIK